MIPEEPSSRQFSNLEISAQHVGFGSLSEAERRMLREAPRGNYAYCGSSNDPKHATNDPAQANSWDANREVRAGLIRWLCKKLDPESSTHPPGIFLLGAKVTGSLNLAFDKVPVALFLRHCRLSERICLQNARIPFLDLAGSFVHDIVAVGATFASDLFLGYGFVAEAGVCLANAQIGGDLACVGGKFGSSPMSEMPDGGHALNAEGTIVARHVFLNGGFTADGDVWLLGIQVGGDLNCAGGAFRDLRVDYASIKRSVLLSDGFTDEGEVRLLHARVGGDVRLEKGSFCKLNLQSATIDGNLFLDELETTEGMTIDLKNASADSLYDNQESWPAQGNLYLDGFVYRHISGGPTDARTRLEWIERQAKFKLQPYRQLAKVLHEMGDDRGAHLVLYRMEERRRQEDHSRRARVWGRVLQATIGYGLYPLMVFWWLLGVTLLGAALFHYGYRAGAMTPADEEAYKYFRQHREPPLHQQQFNAFVYSLENSVPLLKLGQDGSWTPDPAPATSGPWWFRWPTILRCFRWMQIVLGWILGTLFVAGVTGLLRKE